MLKVEDYTKENLEECISFLKKEITRVKNALGSSGFIKYSPMGMIMINYSKELKLLCKSMIDDLDVMDNLEEDINNTSITKCENNNETKPLLFVGECELLNKGDSVYVWDGDMPHVLSREFVKYGEEGGVIVKTPDGNQIHYWNYSTTEPSKEVLDFTYKYGTTVIGTDKDK